MASTIHTINPGGLSPRVRTGISGLDALLGGGFLPGNSVLLRGTPGSGKTALGMQLISNGILLYDEPGLVLSFEIFAEQLYRDALSFGWDFHQLENQGKLRVFFARRDDLYSSFAEKESAVISRITDSALDMGSRRVLIDSATQFWQLPMPLDEQRKVFYEFVMKLKALGLTPILTSEATGSEDAFGPEEFAVDTILKLDHGPAAFTGGYRTRTIEVVKARGQKVAEGRHPLRIYPDGVRVYPCLPPEPVPIEEEVCLTGRASTGVPDLDDLLNGGFQRGTMTMVAGMTGTGKTTLAAHFVASALEKGEAAIYVSVNERAGQTARHMDNRGLGFSRAMEDGRLTFLHASTSGLQAVEVRHLLEDAIGKSGATQIVIDGLRDLLRTAASDAERDYALSLYHQLFNRHGITALCTWRVDDISGLSSLAAIPHASTFDNILYLGLIELQSQLRKVISIFKTRGESADTALRELIIMPGEIRIAEFFSGLTGILKGTPSGQIPDAGREILEPLMKIRDFVHGAEVVTPEQAQMVMSSLRSEFDVLAQKLRQHFRLGDDSADYR